MNLYVWLALCFVLLSIVWSLWFFRARLAHWVATHPEATRIVAVIVAVAMIVLALIPLAIITYHATG